MTSPCQAAKMLAVAVRRLREDNDRLRRENARLTRELAALSAEAPAPATVP